MRADPWRFDKSSLTAASSLSDLEYDPNKDI